MKKLFFLFTLSLFALGQMWGASYTFSNGQKIYIDCTAFEGSIDIPVNNETNKRESTSRSGGAIYSVTFIADVKWSTSNNFFKTYPQAGGENKLVFIVPTDGKNCAVIAADGASWYWDTYTSTEPEVSFSGLPGSYVQGQNVVFAATSQNVTDPTYRFYVKQGSSEYSSAITNYTFADAGSYTIKVEVRSNDVGDALALAEQNITVQAGYYFTEGTTIYIDFTQVSGGANFPKVNSQGTQYDANAGGTIKTITFTADVTWLTSQTFIKTETGNWQSRKFIVPAAGQNYITVPADGNSFVWSTYDPDGPSVAFDALPDAIAQGTEVTFAATSEHVTNPVYTFYVKKGSGEYGSAVASYTFNEGGSYTVKVEVREEGASGDALAYAEKTINCTASYTVYFRNTVN